MKLLSTPQSNPKVAKNMKQGVLTAPLHLAPYNLSGYQTCPMASKGCAAACLNTAGRGGIPARAGDPSSVMDNPIQAARVRKTHMYFKQRDAFMQLLVRDVQSLERKAKKLSLSCGVRLNATSDIPFERVPLEHLGNSYRNIMELFPDVQFYDYTAITKRAIAWANNKMPSNYHLTFSAKEDNDNSVKQVAEQQGNIAVVFGADVLPKEYLNLPVINGDEHDYRPADPKGVIVGLKAKGKAKKDTTGFVRNG